MPAVEDLFAADRLQDELVALVFILSQFQLEPNLLRHFMNYERGGRARVNSPDAARHQHQRSDRRSGDSRCRTFRRCRGWLKLWFAACALKLGS